MIIIIRILFVLTIYHICTLNNAISVHRVHVDISLLKMMMRMYMVLCAYKCHLYKFS